MRVLHVLDHSVPLQSGYTFRTLSILEQQHALGWETCHITSSKHTSGDASEEDVDGFHFYRTIASEKWYDRFPVVNQLAVVRDLERRLEEVVDVVRPDVIHAHSPALNGLAALRVSRRRRIPMVYELRALWEDAAVDHGTTTEGSLRYRLSRYLETFVLRRAHAVTTISEGLHKDIAHRGIDSSKVTVIPNAVNLDRFKMARPPDPTLRAALGLDGAVVLGFVGSFYGYEGLRVLVDAMPAILDSHPQTRLVLVGGGFVAEALKRQVSDLGLDGAVHFTGRVPHADVDSYYSLMDVMVYPRLSMRLTELVTPLKPLEAMAQGRLVVASDVGGHREMIRDGQTGALFESGNATALAEAVLRMLAAPERWDEFRHRARRYVEQDRSWVSVVSRYTSVYEQALATGR